MGIILAVQETARRRGGLSAGRKMNMALFSNPIQLEEHSAYLFQGS
jgi:hypothetical protein